MLTPEQTRKALAFKRQEFSSDPFARVPLSNLAELLREREQSVWKDWRKKLWRRRLQVNHDLLARHFNINDQ